MPVSRFLRFILWFVLAPCAMQDAALAAELANLTLASTATMTDLPMFIAQSRGYFKEEGVVVSIVQFDSGARMMPALASGEIDVATGGTSAGFYNAIARGMGIRVVADKSRTPPGRHAQALLVRKALIDSGRVKTLSDFKGLRVASAAIGSSAMATLNRLYRLAGLTSGDIERVYLGVPQQIAAMTNGAVDAAMPTEPVASEIERQGVAVRFMNDDEIYPDHQISVMFYSDQLRRQRREAALGFMRGYLRGVRAQNASIVNGRLSGPDTDEFTRLIAANTPVKDVALLREVTMSDNSGDGLLNIDSLREDYEVYRAEGLLEGEGRFADSLDLSFAREAVAELAARTK